VRGTHLIWRARARSIRDRSRWNIRSGEPKQASTDVAGVEVCNESYIRIRREKKRDEKRELLKPEAARSRESEDAAI